MAECAACGTRATKLFHVTTATPKGKCIVDAINERLGEQKARRVDPARKESVKTKLKKKNDESGEYVCIGCATPLIAEARRRREEAPAEAVKAAVAKVVADCPTLRTRVR